MVDECLRTVRTAVAGREEELVQPYDLERPRITSLTPVMRSEPPVSSRRWFATTNSMEGRRVPKSTWARSMTIRDGCRAHSWSSASVTVGIVDTSSSPHNAKVVSVSLRSTLSMTSELAHSAVLIAAPFVVSSRCMTTDARYL
jgi:hypothetical protein